MPRPRSSLLSAVAVTKLTAAHEARIAALVKDAVR
jgi:hypothetical protein